MDYSEIRSYDTDCSVGPLNRGSDRYFTPARLWESFLHTTQKKNREKRQGMRELPPATTRLGTFREPCGRAGFALCLSVCVRPRLVRAGRGVALCVPR